MLVHEAPRHRIFVLSALSALTTTFTAGTTLLDTGIYEDALPTSLLLGTLGFDAMSLLVALALLALIVALRRGADRFWLLWVGLQGYLLYAYSLYAFGLVFTPFFLLYLAIMGLSAYALAGFALSFDRSVLGYWKLNRLPRRTMGVSLLVIALAFAALWLMMILGMLGQELPESAAIVLVLDLAFTLPLLVIVGVLLIKHRPLGDLLAPGVFGMSAAIVLGVAFGEFLRPLYGERFHFEFAAPYLIPGLVCLGFSLLAFRRVSGAVSAPTI